jgi:hypothetical protein
MRKFRDRQKLFLRRTRADGQPARAPNFHNKKAGEAGLFASIHPKQRQYLVST